MLGDPTTWSKNETKSFWWNKLYKRWIQEASWKYEEAIKIWKSNNSLIRQIENYKRKQDEF